MNVLFRSSLGAALARPWVDGVGLAGLRRWYFPLSRLWAAANAAGDDVARFRTEVGAPLARIWPDSYLGGLLRRNVRAQAAAAAARLYWEDAAFGAAGGPDIGLLDHERRQAATRHLATRALFYPLLFPRRPPIARWQVACPQVVEAEFGTLLDDPAALYCAPIDPASIAVSRSSVKGGLSEYWLRASTPAPRLAGWRGSERLYARVVEPADAAPDATLIFGSGLCLEFDLLAIARDPGARLAGLGWRVIEPISPFHGLRAMPDRYGGEPFFAAAPAATIDLLAGQTIESALLISWCRARFGGKVAIAGISMTSFVAQLVASHCHAWPAEARPDGAMLISHSGRMEDVTFGGALAAALGLDRQLAAAGWSRATLGRIAKLLDPSDAPVLPASRIVSVLGETDRWVPYEDGLDVARRWRLPEANVFRYPLGHLGMPVQLTRDTAPFDRLRRVLAES